ncbi:MAG: apolipoprotein N-acyltransferase [Holosporaceae bacterium]|jgi:apolipoprotein N-acyltransferase|nr:apolipoprotein N-acyltransferase [Holosporaceae bacterium]
MNFKKPAFFGLATALSFAPFNVFPIFIATFAWLFVKIFESKDVKKLLAESFCFFFFWHLACLYWIAYPLTFDSKHWILIPFAITLIPAYLSLWLLAAVLITKLIQRVKFVDEFLLPVFSAAAFCCSIWIYSNYLPGFPWILPAYIWNCHEIFMQTLSLYGADGLNFTTLLISFYFGSFFVCRKRGNTKKAIVLVSISVGLLLFIALFGWRRLANNPVEFIDKRIRIIQCAIPQEEKNDGKFAFTNLRKHLEKSRGESKADFVVWPEASVPYLYREDFEQLNDYLKSPLNEGEYLLAGAVRKDLATEKIYNSVVVINCFGKNVSNYDKSRLVPFGEYVPFRKYLPFQSVAVDIGDFDRGNASANVLELNGVKIAFAVCYEIAFPREIFNAPVDLIVNVTNDGWFGLTTEPFQHLQITKAAAIERGIPIARATNSGISAVFDAYGREIARIPINQAGVIEVNIPKKAADVFSSRHPCERSKAKRGSRKMDDFHWILGFSAQG